MVWDHIKWAIGHPQRRIGLRGVAVLLTDYQVCRGYGDPHGDSHGYGYRGGYGDVNSVPTAALLIIYFILYVVDGLWRPAVVVW